MDAFFASVEQLTRPTLRGRPVLVGGLGGRGVVAGASYESRVFGARSAMPMHQARRLVGAAAVVLPPRGVVYGLASRRVFETVRARVPVLEQLSFDEAFGEPDVLIGASSGEVAEFCQQLRADVAAVTGLVASVGAGSGKQIAKIASGLAKPDGIRVVAHDEERELLEDLPVRKLWGIGPVAEDKLHKLGIDTVGGFAALSDTEVANILGPTVGPALHRLARGIDDRPVAENAPAKQISAESTFPEDLTTLRQLRDAAGPIGEHAHRRLLKDGRGARTVTVKLKKSDMSTLTRSATLPYATTDAGTLIATAHRLLLDPVDIVVGRDGRLSGPELVEGLVEGLRRAGRNVIDVGMVPSPVVYFAAFHLRAGSGVAVTGSHNPPDYNGFKVVVGGQTLSGEAIVELYARIRDGRLRSDTPGSYSQQDVSADYIRRIADDVQLERPLKVVADAGNGVAGEIAPRLLEAIGAEVVPLYCEIDGTFPNHHPDPSEPHNLQDLVQTVRQFDADLGLAFDGDGDRLGVVTREGRIVYADRLLMLYAADVLQRNPGALVIYDVKCTGKLSDYILRHGGSPQMWKTGHSLIKAKMRETEAELAGEMSGHFFFKERWYGFDDGLYAAARLLEILAGRFETPSEVLDGLPDSVSTPEIKLPLEAGVDPHELVARFAAAAQVEDSPFTGARLTTIDGLRADWNDGWGLLRASNTTPVLVLRFEADDEHALGRIRTLFREQLQPLLPETTLGF